RVEPTSRALDHGQAVRLRAHAAKVPCLQGMPQSACLDCRPPAALLISIKASSPRRRSLGYCLGFAVIASPPLFMASPVFMASPDIAPILEHSSSIDFFFIASLSVAAFLMQSDFMVSAPIPLPAFMASSANAVLTIAPEPIASARSEYATRLVVSFTGTVPFWPDDRDP